MFVVRRRGRLIWSAARQTFSTYCPSVTSHRPHAATRAVACPIVPGRRTLPRDRSAGGRGHDSRSRTTGS